jgi:DNA-binding PadR family transcriptional regulator
VETYEIEELNPLQTFLMVLVEFGLTTPYDLLTQAGLGAGLTSPALKRLEKARLLISTPGPRNRLRYAITEKGQEVLRRNLERGQNRYWRYGQADVYESLPRGVTLTWLDSGVEQASEGADRAADKLLALSHKKAREATELHGLMDSLQRDIESKHPSADPGVLVATVYRWIKAEADAALYRLQAKAIEEIRPLLKDLPAAPHIR